jgi:hypothetical protein
MLTEPAPDPVPEPPADPLDVVVLVVPENVSTTRLVDVIAEMSARHGAAVLAVFPPGVDARTVRQIAAAGADHCVVAPRSTELFAHMQRARADARHRRGEVDPLDAFWRSRSVRR